MTRPAAYDPQDGYRFQILCRNGNGKAWEHCDYAKDKTECRYLIGEYCMAYGAGWEFRSILLPSQFWPKVEAAR